MPRNNDIHSILLIGSGPIMIGQACEFDYSGSQACKVLRQDGFRVVLINSNPATIMTDPEMADAIYLEPISVESIEKIIEKEISKGQPIDAILPTIGGQTALNVAIDLFKKGVLKKYNVKLIGADIDAIEKAENRDLFKGAMDELGYAMSSAISAHSLDQAHQALKKLEFPIVIRPSFTLGGAGGAIAFNRDEFHKLTENGLTLSPIHKVLLERSLLGWKEFELEVMKDVAGNVVIICSIENLDPMGIHTGDSITVAPQQTLSDKAYQKLRNMSIEIIKKIGVDTGGANIQYAVNPKNDQVMVIEMNPRVSRSSALASKATGFPIAKIAAKLAVGYHLHEIENDITRVTPACFEPSLDYVVTKIPRFAFEKFRIAPPVLGVQMKSVGETMAIGRTFAESLQKACRGVETGRCGFDGVYFSYDVIAGKSKQQLTQLADTTDSSSESSKAKKIAKEKVSQNDYQRLFYLKDLFFFGVEIEEIYQLTKIDYWYLQNLHAIFQLEKLYWGSSIEKLTYDEVLELKREGFSDLQIASLCGSSEETVRKHRQQLNIRPVYKCVDTCSAEFAAETPYFYGTYEEEDELAEFMQTLPASKSSGDHKNGLQATEGKGPVVILGSGPNRIGQGIEFDYMCVKACQALRKLGYRSVMVNCNPETVSTDYDVSDILFFEPLTREDVLELLYRINPLGVIIHLGGQTPLNLAKSLEKNGIPILGTSCNSIFAAEDRKQFKAMLDELGFKQPASETVVDADQARQTVQSLGFPLLIRPSFVLGGRAMRVVENEKEFFQFYKEAQQVSEGNPVLLDKFLVDAQEIDVDLICDGQQAVICGMMEHIELAGVHSGDSACIFPMQNISPQLVETIAQQCKKLALQIGVRGFLNVQIAIKNDLIFFIEANPRGSRTIPFINKAMVYDWVAVAVTVMLGGKLTAKELSHSYENHQFKLTFIKEAVLPFAKFYEEDIILGPEMKSTGEVIGVGTNTAEAFFKAQIGASLHLPAPGDGSILITLNEKIVDKIVPMCKKLTSAGYTITATKGTHRLLNENGIEAELIKKIGEGMPNIYDAILNRKITLIFNTPLREHERKNDKEIRLLARQKKIGVFTSLSAMKICTDALIEASNRNFEVYSIKNDFNHN